MKETLSHPGIARHTNVQANTRRLGVVVELLVEHGLLENFRGVFNILSNTWRVSEAFLNIAENETAAGLQERQGRMRLNRVHAMCMLSSRVHSRTKTTPTREHCRKHAGPTPEPRGSEHDVLAEPQGDLL